MNIRNVFEPTFVKFILCGCINTAVGILMMFALYHICSVGYWAATFITYVIGSVQSFLLNKVYTFQNRESYAKTLKRFFINIILCYYFSYGFAEYFVCIVFGNSFLHSELEQIAMVLGCVVFTAFNYFMQKHWVFKEKI